VSPLPETVGTAFAHLQHAFDSVVVWGFRKMRSSGEVQTRKSHRLMRIARGTLGILGRTGDAYYRKYEELKRAKR
jgi:hypothetical protein